MRLLALASNQWAGQWVNRQQLLSRIGMRHTVLYSTGGWYSWDLASAEWRRAPAAGAIRRADNVWVDEPSKLLVRVPRLRAVDATVLRLQARRWSNWLKKRGDAPLVAHIFHPSFACYLPYLEFDRLVYHPHDWFEAMSGWNPELAAREGLLLERADLVVAPSEPIMQRLQQKSGREIRVLPNAADVDAFLRAAVKVDSEPPDLAAIPRPRIGYTGQLHPQVDLGTVAALARQHPDWHFVLIGKVVTQRADPFGRELEECRHLSNVHFLGPKAHTEVPQYVAAMDVNIMCYRLSQGAWVQAGYPLKLNEYLAAGRPIVSVDLESIRSLTHLLRIAHDVPSWEHSIAEALSGRAHGSTEDRRTAARQNTWDLRAAQLESWLSDLVSVPAHPESHAA